MRQLVKIVFLLLCSASLVAYAQQQTKTANPPQKNSASKKTPQIKKLFKQLKGFDLGAWYDDGKWHVTLLPGTNRIKTEAEFTSRKGCVEQKNWVKIIAIGEEGFDALLQRIPEGSDISFSILQSSRHRPVAERQKLRNIFKKRCLQEKLQCHQYDWITYESVRRQLPTSLPKTPPDKTPSK
jgi:hypothetical protein